MEKYCQIVIMWGPIKVVIQRGLSHSLKFVLGLIPIVHHFETKITSFHDFTKKSYCLGQISHPTEHLCFVSLISSLSPVQVIYFPTLNFDQGPKEQSGSMGGIIVSIACILAQ